MRSKHRFMALLLVIVMSLGIIGAPLIQSGLIGHATEITDGTENSSENGSKNGEEPKNDNTETVTPEPTPTPVAPDLPSCSLARKTLTTEAVDIEIGDTGSLNLEYALISVDARLSNSSWKSTNSNTITVSKTGSYDFYYRVTDSDSGLSTTSSKYTIYYDTKSPKAPTISTEKSAEDQCVYVEITTSSDDGSPIENTWYRIDNESWREYRGRISLDDEDTYTIETYCVDECGNESSTTKKSVSVSFKDLIALPSVKRLDSSPSADSIRYRLSDYNSVYDYEYKFTSKGSKSGNNDWERCTSSTYMEVDEPGNWDLYIKVEYDGKTINGKVASCVIDRTPPEVYEVTKSNNTSSSKSITLSVDAKDEVSGRELRYSFNNGDHWQSGKTKTFKDSTILKIGDIQVKDECGNVAYAPYAYQIDIGTSNAYYKRIQAYYTKDKMDIDSTAVNIGYVSGIGNGLFAPDNKIRRCELATILNRVIDFSGNSTAVIRYSDVDTSNWAYQSIINVQRYDLIKTEDAFFYPNKEVTRGELAHALCQFIDLDGVNPGEYDLSDIAKSEFKDDIIKIYTTGLMEGYGNNKFGPNDILTRAQVVAVINRIINISDSAAQYGKHFTDVPETHWAYQDILKASH